MPNIRIVTITQGPPGFSGVSGYSGTSGYSGRSGYSGYSGFSSSTAGTSGFSGFSGAGTSGFSGFSGIGTSGFSGFSGTGGAGGPIPAARVFNSAVQSLANDDLSIITFDSERWDNDSIHAGGAPTRLTCNTAGLYEIIADIGFAANGTGIRVAFIVLNATTLIAASAAQAGATYPTRLVVATQYNLAATNYVELWVIQVSGGSLNTEQSAQISPEFMMARLGSLT